MVSLSLQKIYFLHNLTKWRITNFQNVLFSIDINDSFENIILDITLIATGTAVHLTSLCWK